MATSGVSRRDFIRIVGAAAFASQIPAPGAFGQQERAADIEPGDRVFIANEDSNTISVIDPARNAVETTINLTSFDEDPRPPFRLVTGGVMPTHAALIHKPLYHGCIDAHGVVPAPDGRMLATSGRGSSNVYLIDTVAKRVVGNTPNPFASAETWDPAKDARLTVWEMVHHLIRVLEADGEGAAGELLAKIGARADVARELAYRLYTLCERKKRAAEALAYNGLVQSWPEIARLAQAGTAAKEASQGALF